MYNQKDIVLIPYPFTDLSDTKKRPVVIISNQKVNKHHYIVAKITSAPRNDEFSYFIDNSFLTEFLPKDSQVRTNEIFTVSDSLIIKKLSSFHNISFQKLIKEITKNFE